MSKTKTFRIQKNVFLRVVLLIALVVALAFIVFSKIFGVGLVFFMLIGITLILLGSIMFLGFMQGYGYNSGFMVSFNLDLFVSGKHITIFSRINLIGMSLIFFFTGSIMLLVKLGLIK